MNKCVLIGRLTRDPELRYTQTGIAVANFTLAIDRAFSSQQGKREADFINCVAWKNQAEALSEYMGKGSQVAVDGRIQVRKYQDKNGHDRWATEVICERIKFLGSKKDKTAGESSSQAAEDDLFEQDLPF